MLALTPDHAAARARLGFEAINGWWVSREEREAADKSLAASQRAAKTWGPKLAKAVQGLRSPQLKVRQSAPQSLREFDDPNSVPYLAVYVEHVPSDTQRTLVELLKSRIGTPKWRRC